MWYEDLDQETRRWMLVELKAEQAGPHYQSISLSAEGRQRFPGLLEKAVAEGSEATLAADLGSPELWAEYEPAPQGGVRKTVPARAARELAHQEFNTLYVRGLCRRLMEEGEEYAQIYLAGEPDEPEDECTRYQNMVLEVKHLYNGHRAKYWPHLNPKAFSVPCGTVRCQHSVRRIPADMKAMLELEGDYFGAGFRRR